MQLNWIGYEYREYDGFGRYGSRMVQALQRAGAAVHPLLNEHANMPSWMTEQLGVDWSQLTISCLPPTYLTRLPPGSGPHWLLSMTEGSVLPDGWGKVIMQSGVERVIVPCEHNADAFRAGGVTLPIHVVLGGTDPDEWPITRRMPGEYGPYTFLALADRGARKGWVEVWQAFFQAFGSADDTPDVRLLVKARPNMNELAEMVNKAKSDPRSHIDPRVQYCIEEAASLRAYFEQADCFVIPSRSEGWGMPHREAAMMGLPVITQAHSGLDDGHTDEWAIALTRGKLERIPRYIEQVSGEWLRADVDELAERMRDCYENPIWAAQHGEEAARWLRANQTWSHAAQKLTELIQEVALEPV